MAVVVACIATLFVGSRWNCLGNQGLYDTNQLQWDFLSRFSKEVV
jgi:hypothetical protein